MTSPEYSVLFVYPPNKPWYSFTGQLSRLIAKLEKGRVHNKHGPYTHCALRKEDEILEATLNKNRASGVDEDLLEKYQHRGYDTYSAENVDVAYEKARRAALRRENEDWAKFSIKSILWLIYVGKLAESGDGRLARLSLRGAKNKKGLFCAEFVSEALTRYGNLTLTVSVNPDRIPKLKECDMSFFEERVEEIGRFRSRVRDSDSIGTLSPSSNESSLDPRAVWKNFQQFDPKPRRLDLAGLGAGDPPVEVEVGLEPGQLPPFLVGLSDLANSAELTLVEHTPSKQTDSWMGA